MPVLLLTGFPGFLGAALAPRLLARTPADTTLACLVQPRYMALAAERARALEAGFPGRIRLVEGDITAPGLGGAAEALAPDVQQVYHLAAVYDLGVGRDLAMRVNVEGTRNVLRFAESCPALSRLHYVSTCYVSGRFAGVFREEDLERGQTFHNHYEETKYLAEVDVQRAMRGGLPATIYRPAIVVGDSRTGETQKYDGIYYFLQWMQRFPKYVPLPVPGDPRRHYVNLVPRDFVLDALTHLSGLDASAGQVYQLADPNALSVDALLRLLAHATGRRLLRFPAPLGLTQRAIALPPVRRLTGLEPAAMDYYVHPARYDTTNTLRDLAGSGIACPPLAGYMGRLVQFMRRHPEIGAGAMV